MDGRSAIGLVIGLVGWRMKRTWAYHVGYWGTIGAAVGGPIAIVGLGLWWWLP